MKMLRRFLVNNMPLSRQREQRRNHPRHERRLAFFMLFFAATVGRATIEVHDDLDRLVSLQEPARRIVSLAPHATEMLFAAGAGDRVKGVIAHSDYPPAAAALPQVGDYAGLDLEAILALRPDLVVAWGSGNPAAQIRKLESLGLTVFISEPRHLEDIPTTLERLGRLAGSGDAARQAARAFRTLLAELRARYRDRPTISVFYEIWPQPLATLNGEHLVSRIIALCGGRNVFADLPVLAPHIDIEAVLAAEPEVIIAGAPENAPPEWLDAWRRWSTLPAVRYDNLFAVPVDIIHRQSPRILEGAAMICKILDTARARMGR